MKIAVTTHAVQRYRQRVPGAKDLTDDSIRDLLRQRVEEAFETGEIRDHPDGKYQDRRVVTMKVGKDNLYLSVGKNTTNFPGEVAVISVLFENELGGQHLGATLEERVPELKSLSVPDLKIVPGFIVCIGDLEKYAVVDEESITHLLNRRFPEPQDVRIYKLQTVAIDRKYKVTWVKASEEGE